MNQVHKKQLQIFNSLSKKKEIFTPIHNDFVGMYVCGPTLYSEPHMGNMRTFINFDLIYRYLLYLDYRVKYVRNITDAGHITNSSGEQEDSIGKAAKLAEVQPLEIVYKYNLRFQDLNRLYNLLPPSIEPTATGHIQEQIEIIEEIIENGFAYQVNGSVYFDVQSYSKKFDYGMLSGRKVDELENETRELQSQGEKRFFADFALWKKANDGDMQVWRSPWGDGNPGWHIECTAMSTKYLGKEFDIHGGGLDLKFPHHEDEIAQSCGSCGINPARFWMHANMLNVNGKKMSKSLGNFFLPQEIVEGSSDLFSKAFSASTIRFFMMQSHYRSTLDLTEDALTASEKGLERLKEALLLLNEIEPAEKSTIDFSNNIQSFYDAMNDDFNAPILIANLFEAVKKINLIHDAKEQINLSDKNLLMTEMGGFVFDVLGIKFEDESGDKRLVPVMDLILELRQKARSEKDWATSDLIRDGLKKAGIEVKDGKDSSNWK
tara:strand:- start:318 stop:1787 length:1470 start_codon:yes stop_codon:yes gene_type:complete